jgi:hypothetical protein
MQQSGIRGNQMQQSTRNEAPRVRFQGELIDDSSMLSRPMQRSSGMSDRQAQMQGMARPTNQTAANRSMPSWQSQGSTTMPNWRAQQMQDPSVAVNQSSDYFDDSSDQGMYSGADEIKPSMTNSRSRNGSQAQVIRTCPLCQRFIGSTRDCPLCQSVIRDTDVQMIISDKINRYYRGQSRPSRPCTGRGCPPGTVYPGGRPFRPSDGARTTSRRNDDNWAVADNGMPLSIQNGEMYGMDF